MQTADLFLVSVSGLIDNANTSHLFCFCSVETSAIDLKLNTRLRIASVVTATPFGGKYDLWSKN